MPPTPTPTLTLSPCTPPDFPRLFTIFSTAFASEPFVTSLFPSHHTAAGHRAGTARLLSAFHSGPGARFVKATDAASGEIVGWAKWLVFEAGGVPAVEGGLDGAVLEGEWWEGEGEREYVAWLYGRYLIPRRGAMREAGEVGRGLVVLDVLCVAPEQQSRGAGSMLVGWGRELADQMGVETIVEAAVRARAFYERCGYQLVEDITIPVPVKWEDR